MRISLLVGATNYPLAGESGVSERVHSSAGDFQLTAQSQTQLLARVRAATAATVDRGNLSTTVAFTTTRTFSTPTDAFLYCLDLDAAVPREGVLVFVTQAVGGPVQTRHLLGAVVNPPSRRCDGCTLHLDYTVTGAGIITPA